MASFISTRMKQELDAITKIYDSKFAGHSRGTRDLAEMDNLIRRAKNVVTQIDATPNAGRDADLSAVKTDIQAAVKMYEAERVAIVEAKSAGPDFEQFSPLSTVFRATLTCTVAQAPVMTTSFRSSCVLPTTIA